MVTVDDVLRVRPEFATFGPALFADKRDKPHAAEIVLAIGCGTGSGNPEKALRMQHVADRDDDPAADMEWSLRRERRSGAGSRHQYGIEGRGVGPAFGAVAGTDFNIVIAEFFEP